MAIRLKSKWHRSRRDRNRERGKRERSVDDLSTVLSFNIWKICHEVFRRLEKEGFRFRDDQQVVDTISEFIALLVHMVDRRIYGRWDEEQRARFINLVSRQLVNNVVENQTELLGPGDHETPLYALLNKRFAEYAECDFDDDNGPGFEARRHLAAQISEVLAITDNRWVIEQVMDIEIPYAVDMIRRLAADSLGLK